MVKRIGGRGEKGDCGINMAQAANGEPGDRMNSS